MRSLSLNKCDETERVIIAEYYQRCFDSETVDSIAEETRKYLRLLMASKSSQSETIKEAVSAATRALSGNPELEISYWRHGLIPSKPT